MKNINFEEKIKLSNYTTIKVGGSAEYFAKPNNKEELVNLIKWSKLNNKDCQIIGAGSNLLINNIFLKGLTICTKTMKSIKIDPITGIVEAEAGAMLPTMSNILAKNGLKGGEWTVGIPGTIGGAIYMNAGSGNFSLANNLLSVQVIDTKNLEIYELKKKDIDFKYRFSSFQKNNLKIINAKFLFEPGGNIKQLLETTKKNLKYKTDRQPYDLPSFGSVFKNPTDCYAGKVIEELGLKGLKIGDAEVSTLHANFIINKSSAKAQDILELITVIQQKVLQKKGIFLQTEVRMIGFDYP
jgi:UDP-N-acetylenolpyruvoylglucosamine reductase